MVPGGRARRTALARPPEPPDMTNFSGTAGDDRLFGTSGDDYIDTSQGGTDTVKAGGGNDVVYVGGALNPDFHLDGGAGQDVLQVNGDYSAGLVLQSDTLIGFEQINL